MFLSPFVISTPGYVTHHKIALELDGDAVCRDNFPLPQLGPQLEGLSKEIHDGRGFALIRGLDSREHSAEDLTVIYLGLQSYIANRQGRQDKKGNMLGEPVLTTALEGLQLSGQQFTLLRTAHPRPRLSITAIPPHRLYVSALVRQATLTEVMC